MTSRRQGLLLACLLAAACTPTTRITGAFPAARVATRAGEVLAAVGKSPARAPERAAIVGITTGGELFAWDFERGLLWQRPVAADSAPLLAGEHIVLEEDERIVVRDLSTGRERLAIDDDGARLVGADSAGGLLVVALAVEEDDRSRGLLVALRDGKVVWESEFSRPLGRPAIAGDHIIAPWGTLHVSMLHARDGTEAQRVNLRDSVAGHAFVAGDRTFIGQHGFLRVNRGLETGARAMSTYYSPVARPMPGQPGLLRDAYEPVPPPTHAGHRVRLDWRVAGEGDALGLQDGLLYLHFYRFVFALDAERDSIAWLYEGADDVAATAVVPGGMYLLDTAGQLRLLNALGHPIQTRALGLQPQVAVLRPPTVVTGAATPASATGEPPVSAPTSAPAAAPTSAPAAAPASAPSTPAAPAYAPRPLQVQLAAAARLDDARLAGGRAFAVDHLSRFEGAEVTEVLLSLCDDPGAPDLVRVPSCRHLSERRQGGDAVLAALKRRASHRAHIPAPPVGPLASAAGGMGLRPAAALLLQHVDDPQTPTRELAPAFTAIAALKYRRAGAAIDRFIRLHRAEPKNDHLARALVAALDALVVLQGKRARGTLSLVAGDGFSMPVVAAHASATLAALDAPPPAAPAQKQEVDTAPAKPDKPRLRYLSMQVVAQVLRPVERKLRRCLAADGTGAGAARISMVVHGEGKLERIFATPVSSQPCFEQALREVTFPASAQGRQQVVHVVKPRPVVARRRGRGAGKPKARRTHIVED